MLDPTTLFLSLIFGSIGLFYLMAGKRLERDIMRGCGLLLMVYPWFVQSTIALVVIGIIITLAPPVARRF